MNKNIKDYLKDVKNFFPIFQEEEKIFYKRFSDSVEKTDATDNMTYTDCIETFGSPSEIVGTYLEEMDTYVLTNKIRKQKNIKLIISIFITILVASIIITLGWKLYTINKSYEEFQDAIPIQYEETIEEVN